jgi:hypothetical protein
MEDENGKMHHQLPEPQARNPNRHPVSTNRVRSHVLPSPLTLVFSFALPTCMRNLLAHKCTDMHAHMHKTHTHAHKEMVRTEEVGQCHENQRRAWRLARSRTGVSWHALLNHTCNARAHAMHVQDTPSCHEILSETKGRMPKIA